MRPPAPRRGGASVGHLETLFVHHGTEAHEKGNYPPLSLDRGFFFNSTDGWNMATPPYYPGTGYAKDLEVR